MTYTPKTNIDTQNDGLEDLTPFKHSHFWIFLVVMLNFRGVFDVIFFVMNC